jgi:two-component system, OmpR family, phosphate regulon sensor histidine kinase PhoR
MMVRESREWLGMADYSVADAERRGLWLLAAGLAIGAGAIGVLGWEGVWLVVGSALAALALATFGERRRRRVAAQSTPANGAALNMLAPPAREIFERLPDPFLLLDAQGRVIFANKAMATVVGLDAQRKHVSAVLRTPVVLQAVERTAATGEPMSVEFSFHVPVERHFEAHIMRTEQNPPVTALLLHDLTAMKRAEEARADFVANASHELRTPLAAVSGFIDTLRGHARDDERAREKFLDIMSVEAARMRRMIDDLLSLTRIEINEHVPPSAEADLGGVVRDAAAALSPLAEADDVTISIEEAPDLPPVVGDRDELIQLFQNLLANAIKYGRPGGHVWVKLALAPPLSAPQGRGGAGAMVCAAVRDDGEGIPREAVPRLTERFYRVDVKRSRERGGTGLGLAIVKHIVNRHQGRLQIESQPGEGSTFTVLLPAFSVNEIAGRAAVTEML